MRESFVAAPFGRVALDDIPPHLSSRVRSTRYRLLVFSRLKAGAAEPQNVVYR